MEVVSHHKKKYNVDAKANPFISRECVVMKKITRRAYNASWDKKAHIN